MSYSTKIKNAMPDGNAPRVIRFKDGTTVNNRWIAEAHHAMQTLGDKMANRFPTLYTVYNYANIADRTPQESYSFSDVDYYYDNPKRSARHDAEKKAEELNERDNIKKYVVSV